MVTYHGNQSAGYTEGLLRLAIPVRLGANLHILPFHIHFLLLRWAIKVLGGVSQPEALSQMAQVEQSDVEDVLQRAGVGGVGPDEGLQGCEKRRGGRLSGGSRAARTPARGCPGWAPLQASQQYNIHRNLNLNLRAVQSLRNKQNPQLPPTGSDYHLDKPNITSDLTEHVVIPEGRTRLLIRPGPAQHLAHRVCKLWLSAASTTSPASSSPIQRSHWYHFIQHSREFKTKFILKYPGLTDTAQSKNAQKEMKQFLLVFFFRKRKGR